MKNVLHKDVLQKIIFYNQNLCEGYFFVAFTGIIKMKIMDNSQFNRRLAKQAFGLWYW